MKRIKTIMFALAALIISLGAFKTEVKAVNNDWKEWDEWAADKEYLLTVEDIMNGNYNPDETVLMDEDYFESMGIPYVKLDEYTYLYGTGLVSGENTGERCVIDIGNFIITYYFDSKELYVKPAPGVTGDDAVFEFPDDIHLIYAPNDTSKWRKRTYYEPIKGFTSMSAKELKAFKDTYGLKKHKGKNGFYYLVWEGKALLYDHIIVKGLTDAFGCAEYIYIEDGVTGLGDLSYFARMTFIPDFKHVEFANKLPGRAVENNYKYWYYVLDGLPNWYGGGTVRNDGWKHLYISASVTSIGNITEYGGHYVDGNRQVGYAETCIYLHPYNTDEINLELPAEPTDSIDTYAIKGAWSWQNSLADAFGLIWINYMGPNATNIPGQTNLAAYYYYTNTSIPELVAERTKFKAKCDKGVKKAKKQYKKKYGKKWKKKLLENEDCDNWSEYIIEVYGQGALYYGLVSVEDFDNLYGSTTPVIGNIGARFCNL